MVRAWVMLTMLLASTSTAAGESPVVVGQAPPPLSLQDLEGNPVDLSSVMGKVVVVDFWASWCGPCQVELPLLAAMQAQHAEAGLKVLAVNVDTNPALRDRFLTRRPLALTVLDDSAQHAVAAYAIDKMPTTIVLDRQGKVHAVHQGFDKESFAALRSEVGDLL